MFTDLAFSFEKLTNGSSGKIRALSLASIDKRVRDTSGNGSQVGIRRTLRRSDARIGCRRRLRRLLDVAVAFYRLPMQISSASP